MQITLTPELEREIAMGRLRRETTFGFAQLEAGETLDLTREEFLAQMRQRHTREARAALL